MQMEIGLKVLEMRMEIFKVGLNTVFQEGKNMKENSWIVNIMALAVYKLYL